MPESGFAGGFVSIDLKTDVLDRVTCWDFLGGRAAHCVCGSLFWCCFTGRWGSGPPDASGALQGAGAAPLSSQVLSTVCPGEEEEEVRQRLMSGPEEQVDTLRHSRCNILSSS